MPATPALDRYSRQTLFGPIGKEGQERLRASSVAIIGCGALGTAFANNLCRAGIGRLVIADRDYIELNNLQRQLLFDEDDIAQRLPKAIAAAQRLRRVNSETHIEALVEDINVDGIESLVQGVDLVIDATDNFETRYLLNDSCVKYAKPWIYSAVIASYGVTMNIIPGDTPCLRCIFPDMPLPGTTPTCDTAGVLNGIVGAITGVASTEALKILLKSEKVSRAMFWMDVWENTSERIELPHQPDPAGGEDAGEEEHGRGEPAVVEEPAGRLGNRRPGRRGAASGTDRVRPEHVHLNHRGLPPVSNEPVSVLTCRRRSVPPRP